MSLNTSNIRQGSVKTEGKTGKKHSNISNSAEGLQKTDFGGLGTVSHGVSFTVHLAA